MKGRGEYGSPPRSRGKDGTQRGNNSPCRFTPAFAGQSEHRVKREQAAAVHPRVRGAKPSFDSVNRFPPGSPPRSRGKVLRERGHLVCSRFTPAFAGQRSCPTSRISSAAVHPRVRGAKGCRVFDLVLVCGSPPRSRGKDIQASTRRGGNTATFVEVFCYSGLSFLGSTLAVVYPSHKLELSSSGAGGTSTGTPGRRAFVGT